MQTSLLDFLNNPPSPKRRVSQNSSQSKESPRSPKASNSRNGAENRSPNITRTGTMNTRATSGISNSPHIDRPYTKETTYENTTNNGSITQQTGDSQMTQGYNEGYVDNSINFISTPIRLRSRQNISVKTPTTPTKSRQVGLDIDDIEDIKEHNSAPRNKTEIYSPNYSDCLEGDEDMEKKQQETKNFNSKTPLPKFDSYINNNNNNALVSTNLSPSSPTQTPVINKNLGYRQIGDQSQTETSPLIIKSEQQSSPQKEIQSFTEYNNSPSYRSPSTIARPESPIQSNEDKLNKLKKSFAIDIDKSLSEIYPFLNPPLDADRHPPGHPGYSPDTLYIPQREFDKMTPMVRQYWKVKSQYFSYVIFFRKGKFWEMYENDAIVANKECDLKLTYNHGLRLAGVPLFSFNKYARRLVSRGYRIVAVDEVDYAEGEKLKNREIQQIITPATILDTDLVDGGTLDFSQAQNSEDVNPVFSQTGVSPNQLLVSMCFNGLDKQNQEIGVAIVNFANLTAKFSCIGFDEYSLNTFFLSCAPTELIISGIYGSDMTVSYEVSKKKRNVQSRSIAKLVGTDCFKIISSMLSKEAIVYNDPTICGESEIKVIKKSIKGEVWNELLRASLTSKTVKSDYKSSCKIEGIENNENNEQIEFEEKENKENIKPIPLKELVNNTVLTAFYQMNLYLTKIRINDIICTNMVVEEKALNGIDINDGTNSGDMIRVKNFQVHPTTVRATNILLNSELLLRGANSWRRNAVNAPPTQKLSSESDQMRLPHPSCPTLSSRLGKLYLQSSMRHDSFLLSPLLNSSDIIKRQRVIHYLMNNDDSRLELEKGLKSIGDLERICACIRIGCNGGRMNEKRIIELIISVDGVLNLNSTLEKIIEEDKIKWEKNIDENIYVGTDKIHPIKFLILPEVVKRSLSDKIKEIKGLCSIDTKNWTIKIHPEADSETAALEQNIISIKGKLERELIKAREDFGFKPNSQDIEYCSVMKKPYLLKVYKSSFKNRKVPDGYELVSETKTDYKYLTNKIIQLIAELESTKGEMECSRASGVRRVLLNCIADRDKTNDEENNLEVGNENKKDLEIPNFLHAARISISYLTLIDYMQSLANASLTGLKWVFPEIYDHTEDVKTGPPRIIQDKDNTEPSTENLTSQNQFIYIKNGVHPCFESFVPNDIIFGTIPKDLKEDSENKIDKNNVDNINEDSSLILLTGGNMSGKSTYLKTVASLIILAQLGSPVPCERMLFTPVTDIIMRCDTGSDSDILGGRSTFLIEMQDSCEMIQVARMRDTRPLLLLDELGRGTSTLDGRSVAEATFIALMQSKNTLTIASTHSTPTAALLGAMGAGLRMMEAKIEDSSESISQQLTQDGDDNNDENMSNKAAGRSLTPPKIHFTHKIINGLSPSSFGCSVAYSAGIPPDIVNAAQKLTNIEEEKELLSLVSEAEQILSNNVISQTTTTLQQSNLSSFSEEMTR